jgi:hypothetical protein
MPTNILPKSPLKGAAPALRPVARPIDIQPGATPPPRASPLLELGNAFQGFVPELRDMLRDAAAREDSDAMALGEMEADKASAEGRLGEIETLLKAKADAGELPHRSLPSYERGFRTRAGARIADGYHTALLEQEVKAAKSGNSDAVIREVRKGFEEKIATGDFFGRVGFEQAARAAEGNFRQRVAEGYAQNYEKNAEYIAAQEGRALTEQLAASTAEGSEQSLAAIKAHLDKRRGEIPVHEVNSRFLTKSVAPVFENLFAQDRYDEAHALASHLSVMDLTGQGGLLGKTTEGQSFFATVQGKIQGGLDGSGTRAAEKMKASQTLARSEVDLFAAQTLESFKADSTPMLPADVDDVVDRWAQTLPDSELKAFKIREARTRLRSELAEDAISRRAEFEPQVSRFMKELNTLRPADLERSEAALPAMRDILTVQQYQQAAETISARKALAGVLKQEHQHYVMRNLYTNVQNGSLTRLVPYLDNTVPDAEKAWDGLGETGQAEHQIQLQQFVTDRFRDYLGTYDDVNKAALEMPVIQAKVIADAQRQSTKLVVQMASEKKKEEDAKRVVEQAKLRRAAEHRRGVTDAFDLAYITTVTQGSQAGLEARTELSPASVSEGTQQLAQNLPPSERDLVKLKTRSSASAIDRLFSSRSVDSVIDLRAIATDASTHTDPAARAKSRELYGVAKSILGFTPEEVKAGVTKHGVTFDAAQIDPELVPVFRSRAELEQHWNNGKPTELFMEVGNKVLDVNNDLTSSRFYSMQLALLAPAQPSR